MRTLQLLVPNEKKNVMSQEMARKDPIKKNTRTSLAIQWLRVRLPMQGAWVPSLVGELRSHISPWPKIQNIKQSQYCNKFNKDFTCAKSQSMP